MIMIAIVPPRLYGAYKNELLEMHRQRCRVFRDRLGWDVPVRNGLERDEYDDLRPTYLLAFDDEQDLAGSWRMLPTTGPNMLANTFPQLLDGEVMPSAPDVWECSRFAVDSARGRTESLASMNRFTSEIICGLIEHSLSRGIREIITVCDILVARVLPRFGADPYWKGTFHPIGNTRALAVKFCIDEALLAKVKQRGNIVGSVLSTPPWKLPLAAEAKPRALEAIDA
jgi:N-acyl-L-homoserine lactone synthetase